MKNSYQPAIQGAIILNKNKCFAYTLVELPTMGTFSMLDVVINYQAILPLN